MKKIECIIRPPKLADVEKALRHIGVGGMTVTEVKGFGKEQTRPDEYLFLPKTKIEIYCQDEQVSEIVQVIGETCHSGKIGDGKIAIYPIEELIRIRTFERGEAAVE
jgi:nitrogen regulatory protein P-II 1